MAQLPACNSDLSGAEQSTAGDLYAYGNTDPADGNLSGAKTRLVNLLPPATVAVVVLFWMFGPESWVNNSWSLVIAGGLTTAFVQALRSAEQPSELQSLMR